MFLLQPLVTGCNHESESPVSAQAAGPEQPASVRDVTLFFPDESLRVSPETRSLALPEVETFAIATLTEEVLRGLSERWPDSFVPEGAKVRAAYRLENTAIIDIDAPALTEGWTTGSQAEILAIQSIVHSVTTNFKGIDSVQILVNGGEPATFAGHIDLSKPLRPDQELLAR